MIGIPYELSDSTERMCNQLSDSDYKRIGLPKDLTAYDALFAIIIGVLGTVITSSSSLRRFLDFIHSDANQKFPSTFLGKLLQHTGDAMDSANRRGNDGFTPFLHRLFGGHDIFAIGDENPFVIMLKQHGLIGIIFCIRHLIADTFSKEGLPLPFSSFLDFRNKEARLTNWIAELSKDAARGTKFTVVEAYSALFTLHAQDLGSLAVIDALLSAYCKVIGMQSEISKSQLRLIALAFTAEGSGLCGAIKSGGIPKLNIPVIVAFFKEMIHLIYLERCLTKEQWQEFQRICLEYEDVSESIDWLYKHTPTFTTVAEYSHYFETQNRNFLNAFNAKEA